MQIFKTRCLGSHYYQMTNLCEVLGQYEHIVDVSKYMLDLVTGHWYGIDGVTYRPQ